MVAQDKSITIGFSIFAAFALIFGFVRVGQNIKLTLAQSPESQSEQAAASNAALEQVRLQALDTDIDGLSDYDELNRYGTSPYLSDTDSDGINDREEIQKGTNPSCAEGTQCGGLVVPDATQQGIGSIDTTPIAVPNDNLTSPDAQAVLDALSGGGTLSPDDIRTLLRDAGVSDEQLQAASDQDLINLFDEVSKQQGTTP